MGFVMALRGTREGAQNPRAFGRDRGGRLSLPIERRAVLYYTGVDTCGCTKFGGGLRHLWAHGFYTH